MTLNKLGKNDFEKNIQMQLFMKTYGFQNYFAWSICIMLTNEFYNCTNFCCIRTKLQIHYGQYRHTDNDGQQIIWSTIPELAPHIVVQDDKNPELINHLSIASS